MNASWTSPRSSIRSRSCQGTFSTTSIRRPVRRARYRAISRYQKAALSAIREAIRITGAPAPERECVKQLFPVLCPDLRRRIAARQAHLVGAGLPEVDVEVGIQPHRAILPDIDL